MNDQTAEGEHGSPDNLAPRAVICFVGPSDSGKTTLMEAVIERLVAEGTRVGAVKHHGHDIELDRADADTGRFRRAGADHALLVAANQVGWFTSHGNPPELGALIETFHCDVDVVVVEGFRRSLFPKIVVERPGHLDASWTPPDPDTVITRLPSDDVDGALAVIRTMVQAPDRT